MKKFSVILLIAVLAIGCVFAETAEATTGITGKATAKYALDIDERDLGYTTSDKAIYASLEIAGATKATEGTGLWGEIAAELAFTPVVDPELDPARKYAIHVGDEAPISVYADLSLTTLAIHNGEIWTLNLLKAAKVGNFAVSALDFEPVETQDYDETSSYYKMVAYNNSVALADKAGVTFKWNGYTFAAAANANWVEEEEKDSFYAGAQTPEFAFGAFTMQGAAGFQYDKKASPTDLDKWVIAASLKFGATTDLFTAKVATDQVVVIDHGEAAYNVDAALNAVFGEKFATLDVYFANDAKAKTATKTDLLSAGVTFDLEEFGAPLTVSVEALDILNDVELSAAAELTLADTHTIGVYALDILNEGVKIGATAGLDFAPVTIDVDVYSEIKNKIIGYSIGAEYENDYFTADFSVENAFEFDEEKNNDLSFAASIVADGTVIENTKLSLGYASGDVLDGQKIRKDPGAKYGAVTAACTISF